MTRGPIDLRRVAAKHKKAMRALQKAVTQAAQEAADDAVNYSKRKPGYRPRTGRLRDATTSRVVKLRNGRKVVLRNPKKYAGPIDLGSRPHVIVPRRRKMLRFIGVGGDVVFAHRVKHPGNRAYRFLWRSARHGFRQLRRRLQARFEAVARNF